VNPTGRFVIGGPQGDCGLTGRKIIVDTYGGAAPHGGGAFSGKDPSKVDRSAAYAGRYVAKNIVAAGLASRCLIQVSYAIGVAQPTSVMVNTFGTGRVSDATITRLVQEHFDLRPKGIIQMLDLLRPVYEKSAASAAKSRNSRGKPRTRRWPSRRPPALSRSLRWRTNARFRRLNAKNPAGLRRAGFFIWRSWWLLAARESEREPARAAVRRHTTRTAARALRRHGNRRALRCGEAQRRRLAQQRAQ